jgi:dienelactone hydrolase
MTTAPALDIDRPPITATAIALVLHGGRSQSMAPVSPRQGAVLRMLPFAWSLRRAGAAGGLVVARLRYTVRGWNDEARSPVADVLWALDQLAEEFPGTPVALVGHSMGGRAALYAAGHDSVQAIIGLAPWIEKGDPYDQLAGRRVLLAHGTGDRMTSARRSAAYAHDASSVAASAAFVSVTGDRHAMLRRAKVWHTLTTGFVLGALYGTSPGQTDSDDTANVVVRALAGQGSLVV